MRELTLINLEAAVRNLRRLLSHQKNKEKSRTQTKKTTTKEEMLHVVKVLSDKV